MKNNFKNFGLLMLSSLLTLQQVAAAEPAKADESAKTKDAAKPEAAKPKQPTKEELFQPATIAKLSETYGHLIQKSLQNPVLKLNFDAVLKGMQDGKAGKPAPMTEQEYEESINLIQEYAFQDLAVKNLQDAEKFLKENATKSGVKQVGDSKLQYQVLQEGKGKEVTEDMIPSVKYTGKYADGTVFGSSEASGGPISISLKQTIPGFKKGILGMKEGEKRRIFIHPELGYGTSGQLQPNALLIFDIEVVDMKPEPKEQSKNDTDDDDSEMAANESLFPDEIEDGNDEDLEQDDLISQPEQDNKAVKATEKKK